MKVDEMIKSLHACAGVNSDCKRCIKTVGFGCARDLKMEAATMIHDLAAENEDLKKENENLRRENDGKS